MILRKLKALQVKLSSIFTSGKSTKLVILEIGRLLLYAFGQILAYTKIGNKIIFSTNGYKMYLTKSPVAMVLFGNPKDIREEELFAKKVLKTDDVVLDIGANIANFSLAASHLVGRGGKIFAFEAHPQTAKYAKNNISLNKAKNVTLFACALGEVSGELRFSTGPYDDVNHVDEQGEVLVLVKPLDTIPEIASLSKIDLIKLDVEGYELPVLLGAKETLKKTKRIYFEVFEAQTLRYNYHIKDLFLLLEKSSFDIVYPETGERITIEDLPKGKITNCLAVRQ